MSLTALVATRKTFAGRRGGRSRRREGRWRTGILREGRWRTGILREARRRASY